MQFEIGYYHNRNREIVYLVLVAMDIETQQEVAVFTDSNKVHWTQNKMDWAAQYRRCDNQLNACQQFQRNKLNSEKLKN